MLAGEGLQPSSKGARVRFSGPKRTVIDGPFVETKELIAGFWIWQVKSMEEAIEWVKRCPNPFPGESEIEVRQVFEAEDFAPSSRRSFASRKSGSAARSRSAPRARSGSRPPGSATLCAPLALRSTQPSAPRAATGHTHSTRVPRTPTIQS